MEFNTRIWSDPDAITEFVTNSWRPVKFKNRQPGDQRPMAFNSRGELIHNALLFREEWEALDAAIIRRGKERLNAWADLNAAGLVTTTTLAEWYTRWRVASEMTIADITMDFETQVGEDRVEEKSYAVPVPIISKAFSFGRRELMTARAAGHAIETINAEEAAAAVVDAAETMLIDGNTSEVIQGDSIPGFRTLSARYQGTAEGDFGTLSNVYPTFLDLLEQMSNLRYFGPFGVYMHPTQYHEMLDLYSDGTADSGLERVLRLPQISYVKPNDRMTAGQFVAVQLTSDVVDIRNAMPLQTRRWEAPNGSRIFFIVMMAGVPRLKTDYAGYSGIAHYSGA